MIMVPLLSGLISHMRVMCNFPELTFKLSSKMTISHSIIVLLAKNNTLDWEYWDISCGFWQCINTYSHL